MNILLIRPKSKQKTESSFDVETDLKRQKKLINGGRTMVNGRWPLMTIMVASMFTVTILLGYPEIIGAQREKSQQESQCAVVDINRNNTIEPETLKIAHDDCVLWLNWGDGAEVVFSEGEKSKDITKDPVRFKMDSQGRYLTDYFGHNETASLLFPKKGTFNYEVEFKPITDGKQGAGIGQNKINGIIIVE